VVRGCDGIDAEEVPLWLSLLFDGHESPVSPTPTWAIPRDRYHQGWGGGLFQALHGPHLHLLDVVRLPPQCGVAQVGWGCNGQIEQACGQVLN
jgi:hypothetical protein